MADPAPAAPLPEDPETEGPAPGAAPLRSGPRPAPVAAAPRPGDAPEAPAPAGAGLERLSLRLRIFLFFAFIAAAGAAAIGAGIWAALSRLTPEARDAALPVLTQAGLIGALGLVAVAVFVWTRFDAHVAKPIEALAQQLATRARLDAAAAGPGSGIETAPGRWLGALAPAADEAAQALQGARGGLGRAVAAETATLRGRLARLEAVVNALPEGLVICSADHRVLLYNASAMALLPQKAGTPGLDRPLRRWMRIEPLDHALARLGAQREPAELLCAAADGSRMYRGRIAPLKLGAGAEETAGGYVFAFRDATAEMEAHAARDQLLEEALESLRRSASNIGALLGSRRAAAVGGALRDAAEIDAALDDEAEALAEQVRDLGRRQEAAIAAHWPMSPTEPSEIAAALAARGSADGMEIHPGEGLAEGPPLMCDMLSILATLEAAARAVTGPGGPAPGGALTLALAARGADGAARDEAALELCWLGPPLSEAAVDAALSVRLGVGLRGLTGREALAHHRTGIWPETADGASRLILPLPVAEAQLAPARPGEPRPEFYDFDLMRQPGAGFSDDRRLRDLCFTVFDTETTGLSPSGGDEIVQIAAARVLNGRVIEGETFDEIVNPGRKIPPASTQFHGLTDADVKDARTFDEVGRDFHAFAEGSVLVAHNAPFDMAFLRRKEESLGLRFDNPVADTVAISARLDPTTAKHTLDHLCARTGVTIPPELRHTALGDAVATAEAFARLIPMLEKEGIETLGDLLSVSQRIQAIRREQAKY